MIVGIFLDTSFADASIRQALTATLLTTAACLILIWVWRRTRPDINHPSPENHSALLPTIAALTAAAAFGAIRHDAAFRRVPPDDISFVTSNNDTLASITGYIVSPLHAARPPAHFFSRWVYRGTTTRFLLRVCSLDTAAGTVPATGLVTVRVGGALDNAAPGDLVRATGQLRRPHPPRNPGQFDYALWLKRRGIRAQMRCPHPEHVAVLLPAAGRGHAWLARFRHATRAVLIHDDHPDDGSRVLETMVLGRRSAIDPELENLFIRTGTAHFLAVSGAHVGVVAGFVWLLGRWCGASRRRCAWTAALAMVLFAAMVDPRPPVVRAVIIGIVYCAGLMLRRSASGLNSLALALIILLAVRPTTLFEPGFQLSFAGVAGILLMYAPLRSMLLRITRHPDTPDFATRPTLPRTHGFLHRLHYAACALIAVGLAAYIATAPVVAWHFQRVAPLGWLASVIAAPLFTLIVALGAFTLAVAAFVPAFTLLAQPVLNALVGWLIALLTCVDSLLPQIRGTATTALLLLAPPAAALIVIAPRLTATARAREWLATTPDRRTPRTRFVLAIAAACATGVVLRLAARAQHQHAPDTLTVTHLAVGRGTAAVIEFPDGTVWLYDCGAWSAYDVGETTVVPFLRSRGIDRIHRIIISHPNLDHYSGIISVLDAVTVGPIVINSHFQTIAPPDGPARALLLELRRRNHPIERIDAHRTLRIGHVHAEFLWPPATAKLPNSNDTSTVLRLTYHNRSLLLTGDIESAAINALLARPTENIRADVLVLPHHGSVVTNTARFIQTVDPQNCIRSNQPGTSKTLLDALQGRASWNTGDHGALAVIIRSPDAHADATSNRVHVLPFRSTTPADAP